MSSTGTKRGRSRGTARCSREPPTSRLSTKTSAPQTEKISKYFTKARKDDSSEELSDSPYKELNEVKTLPLDNSASDFDDFSTPKAINKVSKIAKVAEKKPAKKRTRQAPLRKFLEDNLKHTDVNPEHLQMALALSASSYEAENPEEKKNSYKQAFEQFGFGYSKKFIKGEPRKELPNFHKKSRYRYVTPILKLRTSEEREALISSKVALILAKNERRSRNVDVQYESPMNLRLYKLHTLELDELNKVCFYVPGLDVEKDFSVCGRLLRDWRSIPGREPSPERAVVTGIEDLCSVGNISLLKAATNETASNNEDCDLSNCSSTSETIEEIFPTGGISTQPAPSVNVEHIDLCSSEDELQGANDTTLEYTLNTEIMTSLHGGENRDPQSQSNPCSSTDDNSTNKEGPENSFSRKRPYDCTSPDLFGSDEESPVIRLRGGEELECYDLTQSDQDESFHLKMSGPEDSIDRRSDLNVTEYVKKLLSDCNEESPPSGRKLEKISTSDDDSQQSQSSIYISDEELNYSSVFSTPHPKKIYELSDDELGPHPINAHSDDEFGLGSIGVPLEQRIKSNSSFQTPDRPHLRTFSPSKVDSAGCANFNDILTDTTSASTDFIIKTKNVTPMANYEEMDTPKIVKELDKFGLKPLKRQKGAKLLKYIYEATHPEVDENNHRTKKRRTVETHCGKIIIGNIEDEEAILERKQSKRVSSCAVPLHIAWYNFVMSNPKVQENILLYEPLQLEVLHSMLKDQGFKFNIQDLLAFLDKKCVTTRTAQGQHHRGKKQR